MSSSRNYYAMLGVSRNATTKQIHKSYKQLALKYHPDRNIGQSEFNTHKFHEILTAYEILKDEQKREIYDQYGENGLKHNGLMPTNIEDLFDLIFDNDNITNHTNHTQVNFTTVEYEIKLTLNELYHGSVQTISFKYAINCKKCQDEQRKGYKVTQVDCNFCDGKGEIPKGFGSQRGGSTSHTIPCNHCQATGKMCEFKECLECHGNGSYYKTKHNYKILIPRGTRHGETIKTLYEDKNESLKGYVLVKINCLKNNKYFVKLNDLYMRKPIEIGLRNAFSGGGFIVDHFVEKLCIESNWEVIQSDEWHKISRKGLLRKGTQSSFGDLFVKFEIVMPRNLDQETILKMRNLLLTDDTQQIQQRSVHLKSAQLFELNTYEMMDMSDDNLNSIFKKKQIADPWDEL